MIGLLKYKGNEWEFINLHWIKHAVYLGAVELFLMPSSFFFLASFAYMTIYALHAAHHINNLKYISCERKFPLP